ncbi:hypothetical protein AAF712_010468 [Marasmius tenuissimus]|uniref:Uncharacterized protein n=1 Tax=Marasmius tenuissimus TaxID=585030 RepID=A0ABR2ZLR6_9AGAR
MQEQQHPPYVGSSKASHVQPLGHGQALSRLLQFSGGLATEDQTKLKSSWWGDLVEEFFTPDAVMKHTLWKENESMDENLKVYGASSKLFLDKPTLMIATECMFVHKRVEIGVPVLPRFFLGTTQSGVKTMKLTLDDARERLYDDAHAIVECNNATWTYNFDNGYSVCLKGPMSVHVIIVAGLPTTTTNGYYLGRNRHLKFDRFEFEAQGHEKLITLEKAARIGSWNANGAEGSVLDVPVNAFGIPQAAMRCLELSDSCEDMAALIAFSSEHELGPMDALKALGSRLRDTMSHFKPSQMMSGFMNLGQGANSYTTASAPLGSETTNASSSTAATSLPVTPYSPTPILATNPSSVSPPSMLLLENAPVDAQSPHEQYASTPQSSGSPTGDALTASLTPDGSLEEPFPNPHVGPSATPHSHSVGHGQGLLRIFEFSGVLATEGRIEKHQLAWWNDIVREYFTPKAIMKLTLWKDNKRLEAKIFGTPCKNLSRFCHELDDSPLPYGDLSSSALFFPPEMGVPVLPRYFLTMTQSGVKSMSLTLDGAREQMFEYGHSVVECAKAVWTYHFDDGYTVLLRGPMTVHVIITTPLSTSSAGGHHPHHSLRLGGKSRYHLKFENFEFEAKSHETFVALQS